MSLRETRQVVEGYFADHGPQWFAETVEFAEPGQSSPHRGRADVTAWLAGFYGGAFSDAHAEPVSLVVDEQAAVAEWTFRGVHTSSLAGEPPTGHAVSLAMAAVYEVSGGEIVRARLYYDTAALLAQIAPAADSSGKAAGGGAGGQFRRRRMTE